MLNFYQEVRNLGTEKLYLSVRSCNALKRAGAFIVDNVLDLMQEGKLNGVRNLGAKSLAKIRVRIYELGYFSLSEKEREDFIKQTIKLNAE